MTTPDLIKLAPTLSVEERYKIVIPECYRMFKGEKGLLSASEITALASFEKNAVWEQYALRIGMFKWVHILWMRDIHSEKFCVCTCILLLKHQLWQVISDVDESAPKETLAKGFEMVRKYVATLHGKLADFFAYREAIIRVQEELYGVPLFDEGTAATIQGFFLFVAEMVECHNTIVRELCADKDMKRYFKPMVKDIDRYIVAEPKPDDSAITKLIDEVRAYAESDVNARAGR